MPKNEPAHRIRLGSVQAAIWENSVKGGRSFFSVTFSRAYKDEKGEWQSSESFNHGDLPALAKVADMACTWISSKGE